MRRLWFLLLLCAGCGGGFAYPDLPIIDECPGTVFASFKGQVKLDCRSVATDIGIARDILLASGNVWNAQAFAAIYRDTNVVVVDADKWIVDDVFVEGQAVAGDIAVHRPGRTLLHEMLHVLEGRDNNEHSGWQERGWWKIGIDEEFRIKSIEVYDVVWLWNRQHGGGK